MNSLETQVGQIFISDRKLSKSFVSLLSEKVPETNAEIFSLIEIPILNPAAWTEYEKLAKGVQTILRKNFRRENNNAFENSIAQINEELAKIAAEGQTAWVGKMNGCLAVRQKDNLFVSTTGKIHAYLFRDKQLADVADSPTKNNPLKTFENFAVGKILKKDFLIFTTTQLFNYISVERLKDILSHAPLATACQNIADIIKNLSDESIPFGTFILELDSPKEFAPENILKFSLPVENKTFNQLSGRAANGVLTAKATLSKITKFLQNFRAPSINFRDVSPMLLKEHAKKLADLEKIKGLPRAKKFFLASAVLLVLIMIVNIFVALHISASKKAQIKIDQIFATVQTKINEANSAYIYNDKNKSIELLTQAQEELDKITAEEALEARNKNANIQTKNNLTEEVQSLLGSIGGVRTVKADEIVEVESSANSLRTAGGKIYIISKDSGKISTLNLETKTTENDFSLNTRINFINSSDESIYYTDKEGLVYKLEPSAQTGSKQSTQIANAKSVVFYGSPLKSYSLRPDNNSIAVNTIKSSSAETNYLKQDTDLNKALDLAIDGSIYVLNLDGIKKYTSGVEKPFTMPAVSFSPNSKIYANNSWKYIYVIDPGTKKVMSFEKNGALKAQYTSPQFDNLEDAVINEAKKTIHLLNGSKILAFQLSM